MLTIDAGRMQVKNGGRTIPEEAHLRPEAVCVIAKYLVKSAPHFYKFKPKGARIDEPEKRKASKPRKKEKPEPPDPGE